MRSIASNDTTWIEKGQLCVYKGDPVLTPILCVLGRIPLETRSHWQRVPHVWPQCHTIIWVRPLTPKLSGAPQQHYRHFIHGASAPTIVRSLATEASLCHEWPNVKSGATVAYGKLETTRLIANARNCADDLATAMTAAAPGAALTPVP